MLSREYEVVLTSESDGGYSVTVPALPGCTSQGETREQALAMIREAIEPYLESLEAHGDPTPPPIEIERVTVRSAGERLLDFLASDAAGEHPPRLSKRTLASRLSIRPETLSRVVRQLKDEGLLDEIDGRLVPLAACDGTAAPCRDCPGRAWGCPGPRAAAVSS